MWAGIFLVPSLWMTGRRRGFPRLRMGMEMGRGRGWPRNQIRGGVWIVRRRSQEHLTGDRFGAGKYPGKGRAKVGRFS